MTLIKHLLNKNKREINLVDKKLKLIVFIIFNNMNTMEMNTLRERVNWAMNPYKNGIVFSRAMLVPEDDLSANELRLKANQEEKRWGNKMIGQESNGNWTTLLGENLVRDILAKKGLNPRKPAKKSHYQPDWETDHYIWEVKTRNWTTSGTAGEKVFGVPYKYSDVPILYGKQLRIVCVAYQEHELTYGNTKIFAEENKISYYKQKMLDLWKEMGIEFVKFSDLVKGVDLD